MADKNSKRNWRANHSPLAQALEGWSNITQSVNEEKPVPPDQRILNDITTLLVQLKTKIDELSLNSSIETLQTLTSPNTSTHEEKNEI